MYIYPEVQIATLPPVNHFSVQGGNGEKTGSGHAGEGGGHGRRGCPPLGDGGSLTGMPYRVRYRVLMATDAPHRQHSSMSEAIWHERHSGKNVPQRPGWEERHKAVRPRHLVSTEAHRLPKVLAGELASGPLSKQCGPSSVRSLLCVHCSGPGCPGVGEMCMS